MKQRILICALTCGCILFIALLIEQAIIARDTMTQLRSVIDQQAQQPAKLGWNI